MENSWKHKIKFSIKIIISFLIYYLGIFYLLKVVKRKKPIVICYHRIVEDFNLESKYSKTGLLVSKDSFLRQIDFIIKNYHAISVNDLVECLKGNYILPDNSLFITFDDGYEDNYSAAYGILKQYKVPATIFIATDFIGSDTYPSWEKEQPVDKRLMLSWEEVVEMSKESIVFGAHTKTHPIYNKQQLPQACYEEIEESKLIIENKIGKPVSVFAYPEGAYNLEAIKYLQKKGFKCAFTLNEKNNSNITHEYKNNNNITDEYKNFIIKRIPVNEGMCRYNNGKFHFPIFACALLNLWGGR